MERASQPRRRLLASTLLLAAPACWMARAQTPTKRIEVTVAKYFFRPNRIELKLGEPVTLALTTHDFVHGFAVPDFNVRVDLVPGKVTQVTFTPNKTGKIPFLCDNFCGEDHDKMDGFLIVSA